MLKSLVLYRSVDPDTNFYPLNVLLTDGSEKSGPYVQRFYNKLGLSIEPVFIITKLTVRTLAFYKHWLFGRLVIKITASIGTTFIKNKRTLL